MQIILFLAQIKTHVRFEIIFVYKGIKYTIFANRKHKLVIFVKTNRAKVLLRQTPSFAGTINLKKTQRKCPYTTQK